MPTLSSLLVQREIATMRAVEDAISRQVLHGGDLPTNLLELGAVSEQQLAWVLGESLGLEAAPAGPLPPPEPVALRMVPGELALRHGIFPLAVEGKTLVVATSEPLTAGVGEDLRFALEAEVRGVAAPLVRIRQALGAYCGIPVDRRFARLLAKLDGKPDPQPSSRPPAARVARPARSEGPPLGAFGTGVPPAPALAPATRTLVPGLDAVALIPASPELPRIGLGPYGDDTATALASAAGASWPAAAIGPTAPSPPPSAPAPAAPSVRQHFVRRAPPRSAPAPRPRRRGPFTAAMAEQELESATASDAVLDAFFDFALQYFEYAALFVLHADEATGRDAAGPGADRPTVQSLVVPLDVPSTLATARERRAPVVAALDATGLDAELAAELDREASKGAPVVVLPVVVRGRAVAALIGDDGAAGVELGAIGELVAFAGRVAVALERLILLRKRGASPRASDSLPPPPPRVARPAKPRPDPNSGAAALARALGVGADSEGAKARASEPPRAASPAAGLPPPQVSAGASSVFPPPQGAPPRRASTPPPHDADELDGGWGARSERRPLDTVTRPEVPRAKRGDGGPGGSQPPAQAALAAPPVDAREASSARSEPAPDYADVELRDKATVPGHRAAMTTALVGDRASQPPFVPSDPPPVGLVWSDAPPTPSSDDGPVAALLRGGDRDALVAELAASPARFLPALAAAFPGPLTVDRHRVRDQIPAPARCGPLLDAIVALGAAALPLLLDRAASDDAEARFWAAHALGEVRGERAAIGLLARLFDEDVSVRRVARRAAAALLVAPEPRAVLVSGLEHAARDHGEPASRRVLAIDTMGELRTGAVVPGLVAALTDVDVEVSEAARRALSLVTRQDFGRDAHRWSEWWGANEGRHRVEWLIDALMHDLPSMRRAAGDELKHLTREYFGYYDDLPKKERERAQSRYREWWEREGRARFEA
jgi:hypothetical protein